MHLRRHLRTISGLAAAFLLGGAVVSTPGLLHAELAAGLIRACAGDPQADGSRPLLLAGPQDCGPGQSPVEWNTQGPKGDPGERGPQGVGLQTQMCPGEQVMQGVRADGSLVCGTVAYVETVALTRSFDLPARAGIRLSQGQVTPPPATPVQCAVSSTDIFFTGWTDGGDAKLLACGETHVTVVPTASPNLNTCIAESGGPPTGEFKLTLRGGGTTVCFRTHTGTLVGRAAISGTAGPDSPLHFEYLIWARSPY